MPTIYIIAVISILVGIWTDNQKPIWSGIIVMFAVVIYWFMKLVNIIK